MPEEKYPSEFASIVIYLDVKMHNVISWKSTKVNYHISSVSNKFIILFYYCDELKSEKTLS